MEKEEEEEEEGEGGGVRGRRQAGVIQRERRDARNAEADG